MFWNIQPVLLLSCIIREVWTADEDTYNIINDDGSYNFGYNNPDSYHHSQANRNNVVRGEFGGRNPGTGNIDSTIYTAGPRGFRPRGKNVVRNYDLNQSGPRPVGSRDDPYFDPNEDPSYNFAFNTRTYSRQEAANRIGDVSGRYSYLDDIGERHNVQYIAGSNTGFHVLTPYPDSNPRAYGRLFFNGRGKPLPRGRTSIQRGLDGSYRFVSVGPDQRRTETSDAVGNVRGSYTYLDEKGVQHAVHYEAGPKIGYRILKNVKGPHLPDIFPFDRTDIIPADFYDSFTEKNVRPQQQDLFDVAASGHVKPMNRPNVRPTSTSHVNSLGSTVTSRPTTNRPFFPTPKPTSPASFDTYDEDVSFDELFGGDSKISTTRKPTTSTFPKPSGTTPSDFEVSQATEGYPKPHEGNDDKNTYPTSRPQQPNFDQFDDEEYNNDGTSATTSRPSPFTNTQSNSIFTQKPITSSSRPSLQLDFLEANGSYDDYLGDPKDNGTYRGQTLVTNVGNTLFTVPPGVSVRAHVQAIDLLPLGPRVPSPSEQYKTDTRPNNKQSFPDHFDADNVQEDSSNVFRRSTTTVKPTTVPMISVSTPISALTTQKFN